MATYAITAVEIDERSDLVTMVKWGSVDTASNTWIVEPEEADVEQVLQALGAGDDVYTLFSEGQHTVLGPRLDIARDAAGRETIEPAFGQARQGRAMADLPRIITH